MAGPGQNADQNANNNTNNQTEENRRAEENRRRELSNFQQAALMHNRILPALNGASIEQRTQDRQQNAAQNPQQAPAPKQKTSAWGTIKHGLFTALSAVATATVGGFFALVSRAFVDSRNYLPQKYTGTITEADTNIIPGTKNERFQDPDVDGEGDDQPIIDDIRRVPLVYEREILDDINQSPTITLHFKQGHAGRGVAFTSDFKAGHAFITLKYTKQDPLTQKNKRYQTTVGFGTQADSLTGGAQLLNGMYVPSIVHDDFGDYADISREYPITNKQFNKVVLAAQAYEAGGYQLMERNCTTFVADMAKAAGLQDEISAFLQEADFIVEPNILFPLVVPGVLLAGPAATQIGKYGAYKDIGKKNYEYGRFGQDLYSKGEIKRIEKMKLNARLYGYDPSSSGEALRKLPDTGLNSTAYGRDASIESDIWTKLSAANRALEAALNKKFPGNSQNENLIKFLESTAQELREKFAEMEKNYNGFYENRKIYWDLLSDRMNTLNRYYLDYYNTAGTSTNILFQNVSAVYANLKKTIIKKISPINDTFVGAERISSYSSKSRYINTERDVATAVAKLALGAATVNIPNNRAGSLEIGYSELAAGLKMFGSMKDVIRYYQLSGNYNKTKEETIEYARLEERRVSIKTFQKALWGFAGNRAFTKNDYKFAFIDLPQGEKDCGFEIKKIYAERPDLPSDVFKAVALERIFGGMKTAIKAELQKNGCKPEDLHKVICDHMTAKIQENRKEYELLAETLYLDEARTHDYKKYERSKNELNFKEACMERANERILDALQTSYFHTLMEDVILETKNSPEANPEKIDLSKLKETKFRDLPQFQAVREQMHKITSAQPLLAEKRSEALQTLKDWKEAKKPEADFAKVKESVETLLKVDACYTDLISSKKLLSVKGSAVTEAQLNKMHAELKKEEVEYLADTLLSCSAKEPLAISTGEQRLVDILKKENKLYKKVNLLEEEAGPNLM